MKTLVYSLNKPHASSFPAPWGQSKMLRKNSCSLPSRSMAHYFYDLRTHPQKTLSPNPVLVLAEPSSLGTSLTKNRTFKPTGKKQKVSNWLILSFSPSPFISQLDIKLPVGSSSTVSSENIKQVEFLQQPLTFLLCLLRRRSLYSERKGEWLCFGTQAAFSFSFYI